MKEGERELLPIEVLLIEDNPGDVRLTEEAFVNAKMSICLHVAMTGDDGLAFLRREGMHADAPRPDIVLLDLNLPGLSGREVLAAIKGSGLLKSIPTIILTESEAENDIVRSYQLQANGFLRKPVRFEAFAALMKGQIAAAEAVRLARNALRHILLIEDNRGDARLLREMLNEEVAKGIELTHANSMKDAEEKLATKSFDAILLDLGLPDAEGLGAVRRAHAAAPQVPVVVLTGLDDEGLALRALQEGAEDYLMKGQIDARGLVRALRYAVERKTMEEALSVEQDRAQVTLNSIGDAVICTDVNGNITFMNVIAGKMTGWPVEEAAGRAMSEVFRILDSETRAATADPMERALRQDRTVHLPANSLLLRRDGVEIPVEDSVAPIHDREGRAIGAVIVFRDVSMAKAMAVQMAHSAQHDYLTGLPNRMLLNDRIDQAITLAPRHKRQVAVLFLDLDGFKHINDSLGHPIGDQVLQSIATRLVGCVRSSDTVSRQGGDEFVILLSESAQWENAAIIARKILHAVAEPHVIGSHALHITTSIGVSVFPDDGADAETLIKNADTAMYKAKENGRQNVQFFKTEMNVRAVERQYLEEGLRAALERGEFVLFYQPTVDLETGSFIGAEALIRWKHPTRGLLPPLDFIPIAEDSGLILPIGRWVVREACAQARRWIEAGLPFSMMAVNVSAREFQNAGFLRNFLAIVRESGLDPGVIVVELTESVLMKSPEATSETLKSLRDMGIRVAVDDFGTGYSSLSYLRKFPIDSLKIDQSFVRQLGAEGEDSAIVTAVINMARSLKLQVVAEGVETVRELEFLREHDCDQAQGYYFSRPVPADEFARLLSKDVPAAVIA
jgi:diguanylate cyclase (GGDEF)-like protein/PAS domain S-box-containing protein